MTTLSSPAGNPAALDEAIQTYLTTEQALDRAATDIATSLAEGSGRAIEAARDRSGKSVSALQAAHARYQGARSALQDYSVQLHQFHHDANSAIRDETTAQSQLQQAQAQMTHAQQEMRTASLNPDDPYTLEQWQRELAIARSAVEQAQEAVAAAQAVYAAAASQLDEAARAAIARIVAAFEATNDTWRDFVGEALNFISNALETLAEWAISFFKEVLELVVEAVALFLAAVLFAIVVIAIAIVLVQLLVVLTAVIAAVIVVAIVVIVAVLAELLFLLSVGVTAFLAAEALGLEGLDRIRFVVGALGAACPPLALFIQARLIDEMAKAATDPNVHKLDPDSADPAPLTPEQLRELQKLDQGMPETVDDLLTWAGRVDAVGGSTQAVVDIARVVDEQGNVSWIVTLPSTLDWVVGGDKGAPNDLDADLLLILYPELRTQYEHAVLMAMEQAGIPQGDPVVLTGWSLGGIMGGSLIEANAGGYNYTGIVCGGSPIDHMAIPADVAVIQVKHTLDPVHRTDMMDDVPDTANHVSVWDGPRSGGASPDIKNGNVVGHANGDYVDTLRDHLAHNALNGGPDLNDGFANVMPWDDPNTPQHVVVEHTQYAFNE